MIYNTPVNFIIMDRVTLRTLTFKSTLNFGKYGDYTVQQVIDQNPIDGINYLVWVYYNSSNISFNTEVLTKLGISDELKIKKPGKVINEKIFYFFRADVNWNRGKFSDADKNLLLANHNMAKKHIRKQINHYGIKLSNKAFLQRKNHGK